MTNAYVIVHEIKHIEIGRNIIELAWELAATLRWFTAGGAIRIAVRQLSQTWKGRVICSIFILTWSN